MSTLKIELLLEDVETLGDNIVISISKDGVKIDDAKYRVKANKFFSFMESLISDFRITGSIRTSETYRCALNSFKRFRNGMDIDLQDMSPELMTRYERHLKGKRMSLNTISFYMRIMRAAYNRAVEKHLTTDAKPFKHVYTGIPKTAKRALPAETIRAIRQLRINNPETCYARDMFLFSFYTRGMSFVDMAYLKKNDIKNGWLQYKRHKTGQTITIKWEQCMQDIVDRWPSRNNTFLLAIIHSVNGKERNQYRNKQNRINKQLKSIAQDIGLESNLTMYVARHSWASIAMQMNAPLDLISRSMGHTSEKTTRIYLKSLDFDKIDKINARIISILDEGYK